MPTTTTKPRASRYLWNSMQPAIKATRNELWKAPFIAPRALYNNAKMGFGMLRGAARGVNAADQAAGQAIENIQNLPSRIGSAVDAYGQAVNDTVSGAVGAVGAGARRVGSAVKNAVGPTSSGAPQPAQESRVNVPLQWREADFLAPNDDAAANSRAAADRLLRAKSAPVMDESVNSAFWNNMRRPGEMLQQSGRAVAGGAASVADTVRGAAAELGARSAERDMRRTPMPDITQQQPTPAGTEMPMPAQPPPSAPETGVFVDGQRRQPRQDADRDMRRQSVNDQWNATQAADRTNVNPVRDDARGAYAFGTLPQGPAAQAAPGQATWQRPGAVAEPDAATLALRRARDERTGAAATTMRDQGFNMNESTAGGRAMADNMRTAANQRMKSMFRSPRQRDEDRYQDEMGLRRSQVTATVDIAKAQGDRPQRGDMTPRDVEEQARRWFEVAANPNTPPEEAQRAREEADRLLGREQPPPDPDQIARDNAAPAWQQWIGNKYKGPDAQVQAQIDDARRRRAQAPGGATSVEPSDYVAGASVPQGTSVQQIIDAARKKFGDIPPEQLMQRLAEAGYIQRA